MAAEDTTFKQQLNPPLVSVVMAVYNCQKYLDEAIQSVLDQTFRDFEFIMVDDGSKDKSLEIMRKFAAKDGRIKLISRPNTGLAGALCDGIAIASGKYIARMDGDDVCMPRRFELQVAFLESHAEYLAAGTRGWYIDPDGDVISELDPPLKHEEIDAILMGGNGAAIQHPSVMMRREAVERVGGYRRELLNGEDFDLFLKLSERGAVANMPERLLKYRLQMASMSYNNAQRQSQFFNQILCETEKRRGLPVGTVPTLKIPDRDRHVVLRNWAERALYAQRYFVAFKHARRLVLAAPGKMFHWRLLVVTGRIVLIKRMKSLFHGRESSVLNEPGKTSV